VNRCFNGQVLFRAREKSEEKKNTKGGEKGGKKNSSRRVLSEKRGKCVPLGKAEQATRT